MQCFRFIKTPPGGAPERIREKCVGLTLPYMETSNSPTYNTEDMMRLADRQGPHYPVLGSIAIDVLEAYAPDAANHWTERGFAEPCVQLTFATEACELVDSLAGVSTFPARPGKPKFKNFLWLLADTLSRRGLKCGDCIESFKGTFEPTEVDNIEHSGCSNVLACEFAAGLERYLFSQQDVDRALVVSVEVIQVIALLGERFGWSLPYEQVNAYVAYRLGR